MTAKPREEIGQAADNAATVFKRSLPGVTYDSIPPLRAELIEFVKQQSADSEQPGMLALTVCEILTNIAKHPPVKARRVEVKLRLTPSQVYIDVADDSTPFAEFDAKCESALSRLNAPLTMAEDGYGLGVILKQHPQVTYTPAGISPDGLNHFRARSAVVQKELGLAFLVDDDPVTMHRHLDMLAGHYMAVPFNNAENALAAFPLLRPDIIVSDLNMPGMDGIGLRRALAGVEGGNETPFIFLSAQKSDESNPYINQLGVDDYLTKPVSRDKLRTVMTRLITRSKQVKKTVEGRFHEDLALLLKPAMPRQYGAWRIETCNAMVDAGGGDFTLYEERPQHMLAVLADVMGHGPQAKLFTYAWAGYLRSLFRLQAGATDPAQLLGRLSSAVSGDAFLESIILTVQGFQLFPDGRIAIASAGHPRPWLIRDNTTSEIEVAGPLPGLFGDAGYSLAQLELAKGDRVLFATDGFFDAFGDADGLRRVLDPGLAGPALSASLWKTYTDLPRRRSADDATLIIAEYGG